MPQTVFFLAGRGHLVIIRNNTYKPCYNSPVYAQDSTAYKVPLTPQVGVDRNLCLALHPDHQSNPEAGSKALNLNPIMVKV